VTTIEVEDPATAWTSLSALDDEIGAQLVAFAIAFAVIARYWLLHHRMIASFAALDGPLIVANLVLVAGVVLLPFSTRSVGDPGISDLPLPTAVMAANVAAVTIIHNGIYAMARERGLLDPRPTAADLGWWLAAGLVPAVVFIASIPVAYAASPLTAKLTWLAVLPLGLTVDRMAARAGVAW
jgi:uncharacterized membrane protein